MQKKRESGTSILKRYKGVIPIVVEVAVLAIAINSFFIPKIQDILDLKENMVQMKEEADEASQYVSYLKSLEGISLDIESEVVNYALPSDNDVISTIVTYEGLNTRNGVSLSPLEFSPGLISSKTPESLSIGKGKSLIPAITEGVQSVSFESTATIDNSETAISFIQDVYKTRRLFDIKRLSWKTNEDGSVILNITFEVYYYPEQKVNPSKKLVKEGKKQEEFIQNLKNTVVYEQFVLDNVSVGKQNLFSYGEGFEPQSASASESASEKAEKPIGQTPEKTTQ